MLKNPYRNLNWGTVERLQGNTHNHLFYQWHIDNAYDNGSRFIGAHPHHGQPLFPLEAYEMSAPTDAITYALAEHYGNTNAPSEHFCAIGSTLITDEGAPHSGFEGTAFEFLDAVKAEFQVSDGGGVQWNHPGAGSPNGTKLQLMKDMYDYAPDVFLGVEFYNDSQGKTYPGKEPFMKGYWDALLASGRHVWGFANPDYEARVLTPYPDWDGKAILLIQERTREACLRAIRNGQFFLVLKNTGFYFESVEDINNTINVKLNDIGNVKFVTAQREVDFANVSQAELSINADDVYARIEASQGEEQIFSQALMYQPDAPTPIPPQSSKRLVNNRAILI